MSTKDSLREEIQTSKNGHESSSYGEIQHDEESKEHKFCPKSRRNSSPERNPTSAREDWTIREAKAEDDALIDLLRRGYFENRTDRNLTNGKGILYEHLNVKGIAASAVFVKTLPDVILGTFGFDLYRLLCRCVPSLSFGGNGRKTRTLIHDFTGVVKEGEMLLVLGRPGAGCSTFLKALANNRKNFAEVTGDVIYGSTTAREQKDFYRGEVIYSPEYDTHLPELNVWQTLKFATMNKTERQERRETSSVLDAMMRVLGISHTKYTNVGNELLPGVSGGERKRISIAETLLTKGTVLCLDNSTKGLDASTALDFARSIRTITTLTKKTTVMSLYQAGEEIFKLGDKVILIDDGRCIFHGPIEDARQYFVDLGFYCPRAQTTADFLTSCTDPSTRIFREGFASKTPKSSEELEGAFKNSEYYYMSLREVETYKQSLKSTKVSHTEGVKKNAQNYKSHRTYFKKSHYTLNFFQEIQNCLHREYWLLLADKAGLYTKTFVIVSIGFVIGSLFYGQSLNSSGAFSRGSALFMSILFLSWLQLGELMKAVSGRDVIARQHGYALYRPSAVTLARVILSSAVILPQVLLFAIIVYFMSNLTIDVSKFWIYYLFIYVTTLSMTSLYWMFASLSTTIDDAFRFSGVALNLLIIFGGFVIPRPQLIRDYIWFGWIHYVNPLAYAFEAVEVNEFAGRNITCDSSQLVPKQVANAPPIDPAHQACSLTGSPVDSTNIPGSRYLEINFDFDRGHLWRNLGVIVAFTVIFISTTALASVIFNFAREGGGALVFVRNKWSAGALKRKIKPQIGDEEAGQVEESSMSSRQTDVDDVSQQKAFAKISNHQQVFTWEDVCYSLPHTGGPMQLLRNIDGYCKPGVMIALMGTSGAGKTTLLRTLSQRHALGVVSGTILVDGQPLDSTFQRSTGVCEQMDFHDDTATIREALEFSALLRQSGNITRTEKIAYVDNVVNILELSSIQNTVISSLSLAQRKLVAIGEELAAKPSLLLFLDEPTSGLDSQSAQTIIQILRKLCMAGQAILCTSHQPSSVIIQQFDMILALNPGGHTFYFGPIGVDGLNVATYFSKRGFECPPQKNIAEFLLETAAKSQRLDGSEIDWNEEWRTSDNAKYLKDEFSTIKTIRGKSIEESEPETQHEFAASVTTQTIELTKRLMRQYWREPSYLYAKLFTSVVIGIFNGFTFWQLGYSLVDMQNRMFSSFLIILFPAIIVNAVVPKFFQNMMLWLVHDYPSRTYGWVAFTTAQIVGEIPTAILSSTLYWLLWYWPAFGTGDHYLDSSTAGYVFVMTVLFFLFVASWGQWITAFAPSFTVLANLLPLFFITFSLFNGILRPFSSLPAVWRYTLYYINPSQWWISGVLASVLSDIPVICAENEFIQFTPPAELNCQQYAGAFANTADGYLTNPEATDLCKYCPLQNGDQFLDGLSISSGDKWRNCGIFCAFVISNYALVYFFIWSVRIKGWGFGIGYLFGFLGKVVDYMSHFLKSFIKRTRKENERVMRS